MYLGCKTVQRSFLAYRQGAASRSQLASVPHATLSRRLAAAAAAVAAVAVLTTCMAKGSTKKARAAALQKLQMNGSSSDPPASGAQASLRMQDSRVSATLPKLLAFDLDGTLW